LSANADGAASAAIKAQSQIPAPSREETGAGLNRKKPRHLAGCEIPASAQVRGRLRRPLMAFMMVGGLAMIGMTGRFSRDAPSYSGTRRFDVWPGVLQEISKELF